MIKIKNKPYKPKPLGTYLVEAGFITPVQLQTALDAQKSEHKRLGEILVQRGWVEKQSIDYIVEKVVIPDRSVWNSSTGRRQHYVKRVNSKQHEPTNDNNLVSAASYQLELPISPKKTFQFLLGAILLLLTAHLLGQFTLFFLPDYPSRDFIGELFNLDRELNIPSFYSMLSLLVCAILLGIIAYAKQTRGDRFVRHWQALSIIFLLLAVDEIMSFHERITEPLRAALNTSGLLYYAWVIPGTLFVLSCLLVFWRFLLALPVKTRQLFLLAASVFISAAIGIELLGGYYANLYSDQTLIYVVISTLEEVLEMLGVAIFIYALLAYISSAMHGLSLQIQIADTKNNTHTKLLTPRM